MTTKHVLWAWALSLMWVGVIAVESTFGSEAHTGRILWPALHFLFPHLTWAQFAVVHERLRKAGHVLGYATLCFFLYRSWWTTLRARAGAGALSWRAMWSTWLGRAALLALLGTLAVAAADEYHQSFDPARGPSVVDVGIDESGGGLAQLLIWAISSTATRRFLPSKEEAAESQPAIGNR
jgi:VanZ family protein